jgi:hypothetical protein
VNKFFVGSDNKFGSAIIQTIKVEITAMMMVTLAQLL